VSTRMTIRNGREPVSVTHPWLCDETSADLTALTAGSAKRVAWRCPLGHEWVALVSSRCRGSGCPVCSNRVILIGYNDLGTTHPAIAAECLDDPTKLTAGNDRKVRWRCREEHEWDAPTYARVNGGSGCPYCSGRLAIVGETDLETTHPQLAAQALFDCGTVKAGSDLRGRWRCPEGHEWEATVSSRALAGAGCPVCAGLDVWTRRNDLATEYPELAEEALFDATQVKSGSSRKLRWRCKAGHEWEAVVRSRALQGRGCPMCAGQRAISGVNDLATRFPEVAREALFDATREMWGSNKRLRWRCPSGHEYAMRVADRTVDGALCPYCQGKRVLTGFNDLATTHPELASQCLDDPTTISAGSGKKVLWRCGEGHEWRSVVGNRATKNIGCPYCSGQRTLPGFNDLATVSPGLARQAVDFDCTTVTYRSGKKVLWRCGEGHEWMATIASRSNGAGCPSCAVTGYDPNKRGYLYLLTHPDWEMTQVGISNVVQHRIKDHERRGWEVLDVRGPMDGLVAQEWEASILRFLRASGVTLGPMVAGRFSGRTESWLTREFPIAKIAELMVAVERSEERQDPAILAE
jgi:hypothetical protein